MSKNFVEIKSAAQEGGPAELAQELAAKLQALQALDDSETLARVRLQLDAAELLTRLERKSDAWTLARNAFDSALAQEAWADAVEACDVLFQCGQPESIAALGMGVWLSVSFPVNPELTLAMLAHIVEETPHHADGAALAAVAARYVIDLRANDEQHESLAFFANNLIAQVAERHGQVRDQAALDAWMDRLELRDPQDFLPRLGQVVNILVGNAWWFDRDELRNKFD